MRCVLFGISTKARSFSLVGEVSAADRGRGGSVARLMFPTDCGSVSDTNNYRSSATI